MGLMWNKPESSRETISDPSSLRAPLFASKPGRLKLLNLFVALNESVAVCCAEVPSLGKRSEQLHAVDALTASLARQPALQLCRRLTSSGG